MIDTARVDDTNDPSRRSWVSSANHPDGDFPIQNLPFGVFRRRNSSEAFRGGIAIGDQVLDLAALASSRSFHGAAAIAVEAGARSSLNDLMQLGPGSWRALRGALFEGLLEGATLAAGISRLSRASSRGGIRRAGTKSATSRTSIPPSITQRPSARLFRPDNPLTPNYRWMPIGYHGRSSSIGVSGQRFHRPLGQRLEAGQSQPALGPEHASGLRTRVGGVPGNRQPRPEARFPSPLQNRTCLVCACSTIGRRAIFRRGNTSRWALFWRRTLRPPFPPGSFLCRHWRPFEFPSGVVRANPSRSATSRRSRTVARAASIFSSKCICRAH